MPIGGIFEFMVHLFMCCCFLKSRCTNPTHILFEKNLVALNPPRIDPKSSNAFMLVERGTIPACFRHHRNRSRRLDNRH